VAERVLGTDSIIYLATRSIALVILTVIGKGMSVRLLNVIVVSTLNRWVVNERTPDQ
jgi:hypothetical protein